MELDRIMIVCLKCGEEYKLTASLKIQALKKLKIDLKEYSKLEIEKKLEEEKIALKPFNKFKFGYY